MATRVLPSPVFISAILPWCKTISADELHVEVPHAEVRRPGLACQSERGRKRGLQCFLQLALEIRVVAFEAFEPRPGLRTSAQECAHRSARRRVSASPAQVVDGCHQRLDAFDVALVLRADEGRDYAIYDLFNVHSCLLSSSIASGLEGGYRLLRCQTLYCIFCGVSRKAPPQNRRPHARDFQEKFGDIGILKV